MYGEKSFCYLKSHSSYFFANSRYSAEQAIRSGLDDEKVKSVGALEDIGKTFTITDKKSKNAMKANIKAKKNIYLF